MEYCRIPVYGKQEQSSRTFVILFVTKGRKPIIHDTMKIPLCMIEDTNDFVNSLYENFEKDEDLYEELYRELQKGAPMNQYLHPLSDLLRSSSAILCHGPEADESPTFLYNNCCLKFKVSENNILASGNTISEEFASETFNGAEEAWIYCIEKQCSTTKEIIKGIEVN